MEACCKLATGAASAAKEMLPMAPSDAASDELEAEVRLSHVLAQAMSQGPFVVLSSSGCKSHESQERF